MIRDVLGVRPTGQGGWKFWVGGWVSNPPPPRTFRGVGMSFGVWVLMGSRPLSLSLNRCCLMTGCPGRQVSLLPIRGGGGGEDAQAPKGSKGTGRDAETKTCKFLACSLARVYPPVRVLCGALVGGWLGWLSNSPSRPPPPPPAPWGGSLGFPQIWGVGPEFCLTTQHLQGGGGV